MATYQELKQQAEALLAQANELRKQEMAAVITEIKEAIEQYGISVEDIFPNYAPRKRRVKSVAKYRDPVSGATWTGKGRKPEWVIRALEQGVSLDSLKIAA